MRQSIHKTVNLPKLIKMIEGYSYNDKLLAVTISPFTRGNVQDAKAAKNAPEAIERMMGFMFVIAGEVEMSIDYANYTFRENHWVEFRPTAEVRPFCYFCLKQFQLQTRRFRFCLFLTIK